MPIEVCISRDRMEWLIDIFGSVLDLWAEKPSEAVNKEVREINWRPAEASANSPAILKLQAAKRVSSAHKSKTEPKTRPPNPSTLKKK